MLNLMKTVDQANGYIYGGLSDQSKDVMELMSDKVGMNLDFKPYPFLEIVINPMASRFLQSI